MLRVFVPGSTAVLRPAFSAICVSPLLSLFDSCLSYIIRCPISDLGMLFLVLDVAFSLCFLYLFEICLFMQCRCAVAAFFFLLVLF